MIKLYLKIYASGGYVWSYGIVLAGIVIGAIYVLIRIQFHQWKDIQEDYVYIFETSF